MAEPEKHHTGWSRRPGRRPVRHRRQDAMPSEERDATQRESALPQPKVMTLDMLFASILPKDETPDMMSETIRRRRREGER